MKKLLLPLFIGLFLYQSEASAQNYENAAGLRLGWGLGISGKHFFDDRSAVEGVLRFGGFFSSYIQFTGLYQLHQSLSDVTEGLQWYVGGGAFAGFWSGAYSRVYDYSGTQVGISGVIGLDYKFADLPINVSADWMPGIAIVGGGGFVGSSGGLAVRYTF